MVEEEDTVDNFMTNTIKIEETIKIDVDQIVEIEEFNLVVEYNMDRIL